MDGMEKKVNEISRNVELMTLVLFVAFGAMFMTLGGVVQDWLATKSASYQNLQDEVQTQTLKIEALTEELRKHSLSTSTEAQ